MVLTSLRFLCCSDRFSFILLFEYLAVKCFDNSFLYFWWCYFNILLHCSFMSLSLQQSRHFSHVTKSGIFKNLNLRKKTDRNFRGTFLKNRFRHLKLYSNPPSWLARGCCHMGTFWKTKDWSSHFWESQPYRFWYVEFHHQRRLKLTKTGISS